MSEKFRLLSRACAITALVCVTQAHAQPSPKGGLLENPGLAVARAALAKNQIQEFVPERGVFRFPAPYNTQGVRLTNASDCAGNDCVNYAGYSYWRNMNNHKGKESMLIFLGLDRSRGGRGPSLYEYNKGSGRLADLGALFPQSHRLSWATGEGWYFSATMPTALYLNDGPRLVRFDVITEQMQTVFDVTEQLGQGHTMTQMHSSDDDRMHSATVRDDQSYKVKGCIAYDEANARSHYYPIKQDFDECQVDRSGEYLVIKANMDGKDGEDNLIVNLRTGEERLLLDKDGAGGHSDVGHGYMIAADNWSADANSWQLWDFTKSTLKGEQVYHNNNWGIFAPAHVSHTNARAGIDAKQQYACGSSVNRGNGVHANEVVCFTLDGSGTTVAVAPTMTNLDARGGGNDYARFAKGNLDVTGEYFLWSSNLGGDRLDMFVVRIPDELLTGGIEQGAGGEGGYEPPRPGNRPGQKPEPGRPDATPAPPSVSGPVDPAGRVAWQQAINAGTSAGKLVKNAGCHGCSDAGMVSSQSASPESARLDFTADASVPFLAAGFTRTQSLAGAGALEFGLRLQNGVAEVREQNAYRADTAFRPGDRFSITMRKGKVEYARNDAVFYTSTRQATHNVYSSLTLYDLGAAVNDPVFSASRLSAADTGVMGPPAPVQRGGKGASGAVLWQHTRNVEMIGDRLIKKVGCEGCSDSGAISSQVAAGRHGRLDFTAQTSDPLLFAGFSRSQTIPDAGSLEFGIRLQNGVAEVREHGAYRAGTGFKRGDSFSIEFRPGKVEYLHNGKVFHTSSAQASRPLYSGVALFGLGASVNNVKFRAD